MACQGAVPALAGLLALAVAGCAVPDGVGRPQPAIYADLAQPGATLDPGSATEIINAYRANAGLAPLAWDGALEMRAQAEAHALAARATLAPGPRIGPTGTDRTILGRSVSAGYHSFADAFSGWRGSPAHDAVLRVRDGRRFAIAAVARPGSHHRVYWVVLVSAG